MTSPAPIQRERRRSFLDQGGANSINNFASSYTRAQSYAGLSILEDADRLDDVSPLLSPQPQPNPFESLNEDIISVPASQGFNHLATFHFPRSEEADENTPLNHHRLSSPSQRRRSGSVFSAIGGGSSTAPQTIFNSINTLMGIAVFSLSFGFRLSGWVLGVSLLVLCSAINNFTAKVLGAILRKNPELQTYGDIAYLYGGKRTQIFATFTFTLDLLGASLSLILLFADSFTLLFPSVSQDIFKLILVVITLFMSFMPLNVLSMVSLTGIMSTISILVLIVISGLLVKKGDEGSLLGPSATSLWPSSLLEVLLSIGIFMAPWGGHPVFPELYKDMRHPKKFNNCCNVTFLSCLHLNLLVAVMGYLMFGNHVEDSLTKSLMGNKDLPSFINPLLCLFLGLLPISKLSLVVRPIISVYEKHFRLNDPNVISYKNGQKFQPLSFKKLSARVIFMTFLFTLSLIFTSFGKVVAFLGSAICCTICISLPLMFYLKFFKDETTAFQKTLARLGIFIGFAGAFLGTIASFLYEID